MKVRFKIPRQTPLIVSPPLVLLVALLMGLIALPGCGGCKGSGTSASAKTKSKKDEDKKKTDEEVLEELEKRKKKLEKPKDDFEPLAVRMLPSNDPSPSLKQPPIFVKPGHWTAISVTAKTNNFDFPGELGTYTERLVTNEPLTVEDTTARLSSWCPAVLPKGQAKRIEGLFYVPRVRKDQSGTYPVRTELRGVRGGRVEVFTSIASPALKDYEHLIVVLASGSSTPAAYSNLDRLLSVKMPDVEAYEGETLRYYHVFRPSVEKSAPLPSHSLAWTTIAYVFWDDLDPAVLTNQQQQAMLDWLHWGGQLVISGPNSLDKLKGSFLSPYLPGEATQTLKLQQADFDELNARFSLQRQTQKSPDDPKAQKGVALWRINVLPERPMVGIELKPHAESQVMEGTGGLVVERRIGGGRVVITRFPLTDVRIKQWKNFDGFFNSVLLRRPSRVFSEGSLEMLNVQWDDPNLRQMRLEPRIGSTLRYFTRDIAFEEDNWAGQAASEPPQETLDDLGRPLPPGFVRGRRGIASGAPVYGQPGFVPGRPAWTYGPQEPVRPDTTRLHPAIDDWHFCGYGSRRVTGALLQASLPTATATREEPLPVGVAAWNDQGAASKAAGEILTDAAGIDIPTANFVAKVLLIYLLVLVPLNWLVFWLIGKVEWAWLAAPLIALIGAGAVIRLAQLDIGFARSRTEVAVLEVQGGYERAHLTRYTALYSSLSSSYTLAFEDPNAVAAPFPAKKLDESLLSITQYTDVAFRRGSETALSGLQVSSNSTGMVHSEQMFNLGTSAKTTETLWLVGDPARGFSVRNTTDITIRDIGVLRRVDTPRDASKAVEPKIEVAYVAKLEPASSAPLAFRPLDVRQRNNDKVDMSSPPPVWLEDWERVPMLAAAHDRPGTDGEEQSTAKSRIRLTALTRLAADRLRLLPGDVRLIGWTDERLPGMKIRPDAPQNRTYTLVLAHLARGSLPDAKPDRNLAEDFIDPKVLETPTDPDAPADGIDRDTTTQPPAAATSPKPAT
jgi:hypothetical protein